MAEKDNAPQPSGNQHHGGPGGYQGVVEKATPFSGRQPDGCFDYMLGPI